jgi:hypothetical protein
VGELGAHLRPPQRSKPNRISTHHALFSAGSSTSKSSSSPSHPKPSSRIHAPLSPTPLSQHQHLPSPSSPARPHAFTPTIQPCAPPRPVSCRAVSPRLSQHSPWLACSSSMRGPRSVRPRTTRSGTARRTAARLVGNGRRCGGTGRWILQVEGVGAKTWAAWGSCWGSLGSSLV